MLLGRFLTGLCLPRHRAYTFCCLLLVLVTLVPLGDANTPELLWLAGIDDDADFDEAVVAVVSATALVVALTLLARPANILADTVRAVHRAALGSAFNFRSPPPAKLITTR